VVRSHTHGEQLLACREVEVKALIDLIIKNLAEEFANYNNLILETSRNNTEQHNDESDSDLLESLNLKAMLQEIRDNDFSHVKIYLHNTSDTFWFLSLSHMLQIQPVSSGIPPLCVPNKLSSVCVSFFLF
jgi:hypothetical protein